jgi:hypothetical protein
MTSILLCVEHPMETMIELNLDSSTVHVAGRGLDDMHCEYAMHIMHGTTLLLLARFSALSVCIT